MLTFTVMVLYCGRLYIHPTTAHFSLSQVYLSFEVLLAVHGTSQVFSTKVPVAPNPPELKITGPDKIGLGDEAKMGVTFVNPLPVKMENITLNVESDELLNGEWEGVEGGGGKEKTLMVKGDDVRMERGEGGGEGGGGRRGVIAKGGRV